MNILEVKNLKKTYKIKSKDKNEVIELKALDGVDLTIKSGEYVAIIGPSGSGKSTLMQIMGLLDNATEGTVKFLGKDITKMNDNEISDLRRNYIGFVFQFFNLLSKTSALDNVNLPLIYSRKSLKDKASKLLDMVGLKARKKHKPNQLSGGQQQRVAIARALVNDPKIIFADEPTGNISQAQSEEVMSYFSKLNERGVTIVLVTHDPNVAKNARRIINIVDGKIESDIINQEFKKQEYKDKQEENNSLNSMVEVGSDVEEKNSIKNVGFLKSVSSILNFSFIKENISVAVKALGTNKFRTFLSILGITIGIASVVTMVSLGEGTKEDIRKQYESMGTTMIQIQPNFRIRRYNESHYITSADYEMVKRLQNNYPIEYVSRLDGSESKITVSYLDKNFSISSPNETFRSVDESYLKINNLKLKSGSFFTKEQNDNREKVCVIATGIYKNLFKEGENPIGKKIYITREYTDYYTRETQTIRSAFTVIGLVELSRKTQWADDGETIIIPYNTGKYRFLENQGKTIWALQVKVKDTNDIDYVKQVLAHKLAERRGITNIDDIPEGERIVMLRDASQMMDRMARSSGILTTLLIFIASISLFVGGIGIMNIMVVSVKERTREIGLRKALGARKLDVLFQFITEAVMIGLFGGGIGVILGIVISLIISVWVSSVLSWNMIVISFSVSFMIALVFGFLPARRASNLSPVEALRYE